MPLKRGSSKKVMSENIHELMHGPQHQRTQRKFGKKKADAQAIAIAMSKAGKSRRHRSGSRLGKMIHDKWGV